MLWIGWLVIFVLVTAMQRLAFEFLGVAADELFVGLFLVLVALWAFYCWHWMFHGEPPSLPRRRASAGARESAACARESAASESERPDSSSLH